MAIELANLCETLHVLPGPGGLLDQDSYHIYLISTVLQVRAEKAESDSARQEREAEQMKSRAGL
jgi:hypothetical protein